MIARLMRTLGVLAMACGLIAAANPAHAENRLISLHSNKCVDVSGPSHDNGTNIHQWSCHGNDNQRWYLENYEDGYHRIRSKYSDKCLDVSSASHDNGANIQQWDCGDGENQQWHLAYAGNNYYMLKARHSGKCLDVSGVSHDDGANIHQWDCVNGDNQRFRVRNSGNYTETKFPIVLVHGVSGFDKLGGLFNYFFTIPYNLERSHAEVRVASVSAFASSEERGEQLLNQISNWGFQKVNLIGHSHGSPTSRYAAAQRPNRVRSVTSVDGVNKGSRVADVLRGTLSPGSNFEGTVSDVVDKMGNLINILTGEWHDQDSLAALTSLSKAGMQDFNDRYPQGMDTSSYCAPGGARDNWVQDPWGGWHEVKYFSWTGNTASTNWADPLNAPISFLGTVFDLPNDGLVDVCSARLGKVIAEDYDMQHADAVNQLFGIRGWTNPVSLYRQHANRLKNLGL
ncbi:triacylglycerol esterase/lipase EstA (alpha/beta hydrolase family) [Halospina denitrificans]|uniref:Triacylglycerol esterase/lipase EstA (Alpha/beta hydrolase family) n=1 Tax=Halospina denitrificans TaxID=332522 RepID=A0A4R7K1M4_9GAMM|nr:alpha/beta fold hydrolase [Halospina denitrificans]TDT44475.1 triacylglycerol esterase/lipase EstA (alpha/beta hydrolase family) [Halospina denitrificans]